MPKRTYRYGAESFSSQVKAAKYFSLLREKYRPGETIEEAAHLAAVSDLLSSHCEFAEKVGCGIARYYVDFAPHPHEHTTCFWFERTDGKRTEFGFKACVESVRRLNHHSLRRAVNTQVEDYKRRRLAEFGGKTFVSDFSGKSFVSDLAHVDHVTPFATIVSEFGAVENIAIDDELLTVSCDATSEPTWKEPALAVRFAEFHRRYPLRLVSERENLSTLRRKKPLADEFEIDFKLNAAAGASNRA